MELLFMSFLVIFMEEKLQIILKEYIKDVEHVCNVLIKSLNDSQNLNLKTNMTFLSTGQVVKRQSLRWKELGISFMAKGVQPLVKEEKS